MSKAIELIEEARKWVAQEYICCRKYNGCQHDREDCPVYQIDQALAILKEQPPTSEFTKECRDLRKKGVTDEQWEYATKLGEACKIIDHSEARLKALEKKMTEVRPYADCYKRICESLGIERDILGYIDRSEASRKELLTAIEEIKAVSCGEEQIECDGVYDDSDGLLWIYKRIQAIKKDNQKGD